MREREKGYSLLEVLIALGILFAGFVSLLAMLPPSLKRARSAEEGSAASSALRSAFEETRRMAFGGEPEEALSEFARRTDGNGGGKRAAPGEYGGRLGDVVWRGTVSAARPLHEVELELTSSDGRLILRAKALLSDRTVK